MLNNTNLEKWFCLNKSIVHPKLVSIPLGITNKDEPNSRIHKIIGNTDRIYEISNKPKIIKNLVYLNISASTFPKERKRIIELYKDKDWVTQGKTNKSENGHYNFLYEVYSHKFVFSPRGNGVDSHRLWESLYLRSIPIVKKCIEMEDFYDMPILFVDSWEDITKEYLDKKYQEIINKTFNLEKLKIDYWLKLIEKTINIV